MFSGVPGDRFAQRTEPWFAAAPGRATAEAAGDSAAPLPPRNMTNDVSRTNRLPTLIAGLFRHPGSLYLLFTQKHCRSGAQAGPVLRNRYEVRAGRRPAGPRSPAPARRAPAA